MQDDLATLTDHVNAAKDLVDKLSAEASITPDPTPADTVLESVVTALKGYGYEITPPLDTAVVPEAPTDTPAEPTA